MGWVIEFASSLLALGVMEVRAGLLKNSSPEHPRSVI